MPPTTGGNTSGSRINGRSNRTSRAVLRASTSAIGTPTNTHSPVLAAAVFRLSNSAVFDEELVISDQKFGQSTLTAIGTSGNTTKPVPAAAGDAKTSAVAPWANCVASSDEPANSNSTPPPGLSLLNC